MLLLRANIIAHESMALLHLLVAALDHTADHDVRLRVELVQLHPQMRGILGRIHLGSLGLGLVVDQLERVGVREEGGELLLEVVGLPRVLVDVILDGDLRGGRSTRYMSFSCCTSSML